MKAQVVVATYRTCQTDSGRNQGSYASLAERQSQNACQEISQK